MESNTQLSAIEKKRRELNRIRQSNFRERKKNNNVEQSDNAETQRIRTERNKRRRSQRENENEKEAKRRKTERNISDRNRRSNNNQQQINLRRRTKTIQRLQLTEAYNSQHIIDNPEHSCGSMTVTCNYCGAFYWQAEVNTAKKYTKCCHDGKVSLDKLLDPPVILKELLTTNTHEAKNYREHIRQYNAAFAFASMGADIAPPPGIGPYCFRIHGQIYHKVSPLYTNNSNSPKYGQLYIFDTSEATDVRIGNNESCLRTVMQTIDTMLREINPFVKSYKHMHQIAEENPMTAVRMVFMEDSNLDLRRYNKPTTKTDIAAIFVGDDGEPPANRDICIYPIGDTLRRISPINRCSDPMAYTLLFPNGECGWHKGMEHVEGRRTEKRTRVTQLQYFAYRFSVRSDFSLIHNSGKLFQQYIVDAYVKTEGARLQYLRDNQGSLRVELYRGLLDALESRAENENLRAGKLVILPSSFQGSPRHMQQNYQDAMAIVRKFGRPDLFITFTCNPTWPEILNAMQGTQRPENRPDIVVRVFKMKLSEFLNDIIKKSLFGVIIAYIYVIEFQKRGLPHAHILLTLASGSKIRTNDDIDKYVSAEIPDKNVNPRLYEIVTKCMIHGPCGTLNINSPCMRDGVCCKNFPKDLRENTAENVNGYPIYRRRLKDPVKIGKYEIDNKWVVPYNPWLLKKFNAHINVEVCASVKSVKYLYKYVYKGHDAASVKIVNSTGVMNHDEILSFVDGRYVSAPEAMWRLNEFAMSEKSHTVIRLPVHLADRQQVYFQEGEEDQAIARASIRDTMLTAWFKLNQTDNEANSYTYTDIPNYYVFDSKNTTWKKRQRGGDGVIGRMPAVCLRDNERYYLRMLLTRKKGAISFDNLKTINGRLCETFQETCRELGLLAGDKIWHDTLSEAAHTQTPNNIRLLFVIICAYGEPENVLELWTKHKIEMSEDFVYRYSEETGPQYALSEIKDLLKSFGLSLRQFNLPSVSIDLSHLQNLPTYDILEEQLKASTNIEKLNDDQQLIVKTILDAVYTNKKDMNHCFFLDGPAGTGKTFVYETLIHSIRGKGDIIISVASTGIAANLLPGGRTAHSTFKIPLNLNDTTTCNIKPNMNEAEDIINSKLIVWDEAPMMHIHAFMAVDRLLKDLTKCDKLFGGKVILLGGDFRQVLPVILRGSRSLTVASCLKKHHMWTKLHIIKLTKNMRALDSEREFAKWLLEVGEGKSGDRIKLPEKCYPQIQDPVEQLYGDINFNVVSAQQLKGQAILSVTNDASLELNNRVLERMPGEEIVYESVDNIISDDPADQLAYPEEFLNSLTPTGMPPHKLRVKKGSVIMLLRNLMPLKGLCNGTRLIVTRLQHNLIEARLIDSDNSKTFLIPRIPLIPSDTTNMPFTFKRKQFPTRLAFSMTINKSQGQTFDKICLYLQKPVFSHGQLYVGLSRVRLFESITVVSENSDIENCVYKEVL